MRNWMLPREIMSARNRNIYDDYYDHDVSGLLEED